MTTAIPDKTRAVQISKTGGPEVIEFVEIDTPTAAPEELLIKIDWGGVNYSAFKPQFTILSPLD